MRKILILTFFLPLMAWAQSSLPPCPVSGYKHNCVGTITFPSGSKYVGEFRNDKYNGQGMFTFHSGDIYVGEFRDFKYNGEGTLTLSDGSKYVGEFRDSYRHGQGVEYSANGSVNRSGSWSEGYLVSPYDLDANRFPFNRPAQVAATPPTDLGKAERDRLTAEVGADLATTLPPCPSVGAKNNCFGTYTYSTGIRFSGEFRNGMANGEGIEYRADGTVSRSGRWMGANLASAYKIDTNRFPFNPSTQLAITPPTDPGKAERDRLTAEVEAERKKREELEARLATEAKERERLAIEAKERESQLAEAKERERQQAQTPQPQQPQAAIRNERRVALLVGNGAYKQSPLTNSVNDAVDLNVSLKNLGFQTLLVQNASLATMRQKTREFAELALNADVALIFFSGHGIEYRGNNYLIPTSAGSLKEFEVEDETFNVARWMDMLETQKGANKQRVNIVILDACRDNAFSRGWRNTNRGLARMDAPSGTILAYATAPGKLASDGLAGERNSPYTKNLLRAIQQPNVPVEQVFKDVRRMVVEQTKGEQVPWENSSLIGNFVFKR